jgi:hypothetical protein
MVNRSLFVESMRFQGLRKLAASSVYESLRTRRAWFASVAVALNVDVLRVRVRLWWPWLLVPFALPIIWLLTYRRVMIGLGDLQIPMRVVSIGVTPRLTRPKQ